MDWLVSRQDAIEAELARRHLGPEPNPERMALFDLSSSWLEARCCPLAARGYSRDGKKGRLQIEYGLLTDPAGRPVAVRVFPGNTGDPSAFTAIVDVVRTKFGLGQMVTVGDRGMITSARIRALNQQEDGTRRPDAYRWITALRAPAIRKLMADGGPLQLSLFDQQDLAEITSPDFPGERLIACQAWAPLTFTDENPPQQGNPGAPARRSATAQAKASGQYDPAGQPYRSFRGLLEHLATLTRNQVRFTGTQVTIPMLTEPTSAQRQAFELLGAAIPLTLMYPEHHPTNPAKPQFRTKITCRIGRNFGLRAAAHRADADGGGLLVGHLFAQRWLYQEGTARDLMSCMSRQRWCATLPPQFLRPVFIWVVSNRLTYRGIYIACSCNVRRSPSAYRG